MEGLALTMWPPTAWHWLALGLILLSIEMVAGTFDLLWVAIASGLTSCTSSGSSQGSEMDVDVGAAVVAAGTVAGSPTGAAPA